MTSEMVQVPFLMSSWALPSHTSVPWDRPEICKRSENLVGWDSSSIPRTKLVPSSGKVRVPVLMPHRSSSVTPRALGELKQAHDLRVAHGHLHHRHPRCSPPGTGRWWARCAPARRACTRCRGWSGKSKWVVMLSDFWSLAGCCTGRSRRPPCPGG